jgi:23S rRNA pseudouridine1911/1915/1917 synthase
MDRPVFEEFLCIGSEEEGTRIDKILVARFPSHSRTYFQYLIENGCVLLNGELVKKRILPEEGDEIEICFQATPEASLQPENIPLEILYEDEHLIAVNKPAGLVVHPAPGHWTGTFVNALLAHCQNLAPSADPLRPGIVHRLDKDTTGVLIAAKTTIAHQKLIELFSQRRIEKLYLTICHGRPANTLITAPIGRHPVHRKEMAALPDGREAITEIQTAAFNDKFSLVLAKPRTGRTHQIRVHLKHIHCPIVGDPIYGKADAERPLLHAYRLIFDHPITGSPLRLVAPIPADVKHWMQKLCGPSLCSPALI